MVGSGLISLCFLFLYDLPVFLFSRPRFLLASGHHLAFSQPVWGPERHGGSWKQQHRAGFSGAGSLLQACSRSCLVRRSLLCGGLSGCWRGVASHSTLDSSLGLSGKVGPPPQAPTSSSWLLDLIITSWGIFWCCRLWRDRGTRPLTRLPGAPTPLWMHPFSWTRI